MAESKPTIITKVYLNNSKTPTTVKLATNFVVVDNKLVADPKEVYPGVKS